MGFEQQDRERQGRIESKADEAVRRLVAAEKRCDDWEAERLREFEALEGRMMTREEKIDAASDGLLHKINVTTLEFISVMHDLRADMQEAREEAKRSWERTEAEFAENRAEARAGREALLRMLDRLPPPQEPPPAPS